MRLPVVSSSVQQRQRRMLQKQKQQQQQQHQQLQQKEQQELELEQQQQQQQSKQKSNSNKQRRGRIERGRRRGGKSGIDPPASTATASTTATTTDITDYHDKDEDEEDKDNRMTMTMRTRRLVDEIIFDNDFHTDNDNDNDEQRDDDNVNNDRYVEEQNDRYHHEHNVDNIVDDDIKVGDDSSSVSVTVRTRQVMDEIMEFDHGIGDGGQDGDENDNDWISTAVVSGMSGDSSDDGHDDGDLMMMMIETTNVSSSAVNSHQQNHHQNNNTTPKRSNKTAHSVRSDDVVVTPTKVNVMKDKYCQQQRNDNETTTCQDEEKDEEMMCHHQQQYYDPSSSISRDEKNSITADVPLVPDEDYDDHDLDNDDDESSSCCSEESSSSSSSGRKKKKKKKKLKKTSNTAGLLLRGILKGGKNSKKSVTFASKQKQRRQRRRKKGAGDHNDTLGLLLVSKEDLLQQGWKPNDHQVLIADNKMKAKKKKETATATAKNGCHHDNHHARHVHHHDHHHYHHTDNSSLSRLSGDDSDSDGTMSGKIVETKLDPTTTVTTTTTTTTRNALTKQKYKYTEALSVAESSVVLSEDDMKSDPPVIEDQDEDEHEHVFEEKGPGVCGGGGGGGRTTTTKMMNNNDDDFSRLSTTTASKSTSSTKRKTPSPVTMIKVETVTSSSSSDSENKDGDINTNLHEGRRSISTTDDDHSGDHNNDTCRERNTNGRGGDCRLSNNNKQDHGGESKSSRPSNSDPKQRKQMTEEEASLDDEPTSITGYSVKALKARLERAISSYADRTTTKNVVVPEVPAQVQPLSASKWVKIDDIQPLLDRPTSPISASEEENHNVTPVNHTTKSKNIKADRPIAANDDDNVHPYHPTTADLPGPTLDPVRLEPFRRYQRPINYDKYERPTDTPTVEGGDCDKYQSKMKYSSSRDSNNNDHTIISSRRSNLDNSRLTDHNSALLSKISPDHVPRDRRKSTSLRPIPGYFSPSFVDAGSATSTTPYVQSTTNEADSGHPRIEIKPIELSIEKTSPPVDASHSNSSNEVGHCATKKYNMESILEGDESALTDNMADETGEGLGLSNRKVRFSDKSNDTQTRKGNINLPKDNTDVKHDSKVIEDSSVKPKKDSAVEYWRQSRKFFVWPPNSTNAESTTVQNIRERQRQAREEFETIKKRRMERMSKEKSELSDQQILQDHKDISSSQSRQTETSSKGQYNEGGMQVTVSPYIHDLASPTSRENGIEAISQSTTSGNETVVIAKTDGKTSITENLHSTKSSPVTTSVPESPLALKKNNELVDLSEHDLTEDQRRDLTMEKNGRSRNITSMKTKRSENKQPTKEMNQRGFGLRLFRGGDSGAAEKGSSSLGKKQKHRIFGRKKVDGKIMDDTSSLWNQGTDQFIPANSYQEVDKGAVVDPMGPDESSWSPEPGPASTDSSCPSSVRKMGQTSDTVATHRPYDDKKEQSEEVLHSIGGSENSLSSALSISTDRNSHSAALSSTTEGTSLVDESRAGATSASTQRHHSRKPSLESSYTGLTATNDRDQITRGTSRPNRSCTVVTLEDDWFSWLLPGVFGPIPVPKGKSTEAEKTDIAISPQHQLPDGSKAGTVSRTAKSRRPLIVPHSSSHNYGRDDSILRTSSKHNNNMASKSSRKLTTANPTIGTREWQEILDATETMAMNFKKNGKKTRKQIAKSHRQNHMYSNTNYTPELVNELSCKLADENYHFDDHHNEGDENDGDLQQEQQRQHKISSPLSPSAFSNTVADDVDYNDEEEQQQERNEEGDDDGERIPEDVQRAIEKFRRHARALAVSPQDLMLAVRRGDKIDDPDNTNIKHRTDPSNIRSRQRDHQKTKSNPKSSTKSDNGKPTWKSSSSSSKKSSTNPNSKNNRMTKNNSSNNKISSSSSSKVAAEMNMDNDDKKNNHHHHVLMDMLSFYSL